MGNFTNGDLEAGNITGWSTGIDYGIYQFFVQTSTKYEGNFALEIHHTYETGAFGGPYRCFATCGFEYGSATGIEFYYKPPVGWSGTFQAALYDNDYGIVIDTGGWSTNISGSWIRYIAPASLVTSSQYYILFEFIENPPIDPDTIPEYSAYLDCASVLGESSSEVSKTLNVEYNIIDSTNLIENGGFETGNLDNWSKTTSGLHYLYSVSDIYKYQGDYGFRSYTTATDSNNYSNCMVKILNSFDALSGEKIEFSLYYKIQYAHTSYDSSGIYIQYRYKDNDGDWNSDNIIVMDTTQTDWRYAAATFTTLSATNQFVIYNNSYQSAATTDDCIDLWVDSASVTRWYGTQTGENIISKACISPYEIETNNINSKVKAYYNIGTNVASCSLSDIYTISHDVASDFVLEIYDPVFTSGQFYNLQIIKKMMQIDTLGVTLYDVLTSTATLLKEGTPVRLRINGRFLFGGILKRVNRDDNKRTWELWAESNSCILRDYKINNNKKYIDSYILQTIIPDILPQDNTWVLQYNGVEIDKKIDYELSPNGALAHITNLCKYAGWEWMTWMENDTYEVSIVTGTELTFTSTIGDPSKYNNGFGIVSIGDAKNTGFVITSAATSSITTNKDVESIGVEIGDKITLWGRNVLFISERLGTDSSIIYATQNYNISNLQFSTNLDKTFTNVVSTGVIADVSSYVSEATDSCLSYAITTIDESYLLEETTATSTKMWVYNANGWECPAKYRCQEEIFSVQNITNVSTSYELNIATTENRGLEGTIAAAHNINDEVVCQSYLPVENGSALSAPGTVWIGMEKLEFEYLDGDIGLKSLTRGVDGTATYAHKSGILIRDAQYDDIPEQSSPASIYGIRSGRYEAVGCITKNSVDKYVSNVLLKTSTASIRGSFTFLSTDLWKPYTIGDNVTITSVKTIHPDGESPYLETSTGTYRIMGVTYNQYQPIYIEFGNLDEYILDSFKKVDYSKDLAAQKSKGDMKATIINISTDKKKIKVQYADGTTEWVDRI